MPDVPDVYMNVFSYLDWIRNVSYVEPVEPNISEPSPQATRDPFTLDGEKCLKFIFNRIISMLMERKSEAKQLKASPFQTDLVERKILQNKIEQNLLNGLLVETFLA